MKVMNSSMINLNRLSPLRVRYEIGGWMNDYNFNNKGDMFPRKIGSIKIVVINMVIAKFMGKTTTFFGVYPKHLIGVRRSQKLAPMAYVLWLSNEARWSFSTVELKHQLNKDL